MKAFLVVTIVALGLAGCANVGNKQIIDNNNVSKIRAGETTKDQTRLIVGEPSKVTFSDNREETWEYEFASYRSNPAQFIPIAGLFASADVEKHTLTVRFRPDGIVKEVGKGRVTGKAGGLGE
jgi:outer membrane protein assembly factor BamE (lipoprotein component of BamABCDE complex)